MLRAVTRMPWPSQFGCGDVLLVLHCWCCALHIDYITKCNRYYHNDAIAIVAVASHLLRLATRPATGSVTCGSARRVSRDAGHAVRIASVAKDGDATVSPEGIGRGPAPHATAWHIRRGAREGGSCGRRRFTTAGIANHGSKRAVLPRGHMLWAADTGPTKTGRFGRYRPEVL